MAKSQNQKMKLTYLSEILCKYTDEEHPMSVAEMISHLEEMGVHAERKSIYDDLECLRQYGMNIVTAPGREKKCYLAENIFQLPELKVLADSVAASRFITEKKSRELIKKLGSLTSVYRSRSIQRQVYVNNRPKHSNESIYYNIDPIHRAISDNRKIKFRYFDYNREKKKTFRRNGEYYHASPFVLVYHNDNYYLIGKCEQHEAPLSQFRVDKMYGTELLSECREKPAEDVREHITRTFDMFGGAKCDVELSCELSLVGIMTDRFGKDIPILPDESPDRFRIRIPAEVSPVFWGWIFQFGPQVKILSPESLAREYLDRMEKIYELY